MTAKPLQDEIHEDPDDDTEEEDEDTRTSDVEYDFLLNPVQRRWQILCNLATTVSESNNPADWPKLIQQLDKAIMGAEIVKLKAAKNDAQ